MWILSPSLDSLLFIFTPLLATVILIPLARYFPSAEFGAFLLAFFTFGHHFPGFLRAYSDRDLFQRHKAAFVLAPPVVFILAYGFARFDLHGLLFVVFTWDIWHVLMQQYGFLRIYDAKAGRTDKFTALADRWVALSWYLTLIAMSPHYSYNFLLRAYFSGAPDLAPAALSGIRFWLLTLSILLTVLYLGRETILLRRGMPLNWRKLAALSCFLGVTWYLYVVYPDFTVGFAVWSAFHCVQYYAIVWAFNRNRFGRGTAGVLAFLFRPRLGLVLLYLALIFGYGAINWSLRYIEPGFLLDILAALIVTSGTLHYYFDGFIWRIRDLDTRKTLSITEPKSAFHRLGLRNPVILQAVVAAGALGIVFITEILWRADELEVARRLAVSAPSFGRAQRDYGDLLRRKGRHADAASVYQRAMELDHSDAEARHEYGLTLSALGQTDQAIEAFQQAVSLNPALRAAHYNLASLLARRGDSSEALKQFRAAFPAGDPATLRELEKDPAGSDVLVNVALGLIQAGDRAEARDLLERALTIQPDNAAAHLNLASALVLSGDFSAARIHYVAAARNGDPSVRRSAEKALERIIGR